MLIDIILVVLLVLAVIKGFTRGLIVGIFSFVAIVVGLAAALKLSAVVAGYMEENTGISRTLLPVLSFALVFIGVVLLIRLGARMIQAATEAVTLGWINRLGGIVLYVLIYLLVYSVLLFYAAELHIIGEEMIANSVVYPYVQPLGPKVIDGFAVVLPFLKDVFAQLEAFFGGVAASQS